MAFVGKKSAPAKPRGTPPNPGIGLLDLITSLQSRVDAIRAGEPLSYWRDEVNSGTPGPCEVCGKESIFRCILCQTALYCTKEHQTQAWKSTHKNECKDMRYKSLPFPPVAPPSGKTWKTVKALLLPIDELRPRLIDFHALANDKYDEVIDESSPYMNMFHRDNAMRFGQNACDMLVTFKDVDGNWLEDYTLRIVLRDCAQQDGSKRNKCIPSIAGGPTPHEWRGPVLVFKAEKWGDPQRMSDISMDDLPVLVRWLRNHGLNGNDRVQVKAVNSEREDGTQVVTYEIPIPMGN